MFKLWMKQDIQAKEKRIKEFDVGIGLGGLTHKISAMVAVTLHPSGRIGCFFILYLFWMYYYFKSICNAGRHLCWLASS